MLLAGPVNPADLRRQLSRWTKAGRLIQLRRGVVYLRTPLPEDQASSLPDCQPPAACFLRQPSVSPGLLIPDVVHSVTSVTTKRPHRWRTPLGSFIFHHIKPTWLHGYRRLEVSICLIGMKR